MYISKLIMLLSTTESGVTSDVKPKTAKTLKIFEPNKLPSEMLFFVE